MEVEVVGSSSSRHGSKGRDRDRSLVAPILIVH
jgi:hypothetical protein